MYRASDTKARRGTKYKLTFPTVPSLKTTPTKVFLKQKQGFHDILTIEFPVSSDVWFENLTTGTPVKFSWAQGMQEKNWFGYVSFTTKEVAAQRKQYLRVQCIGSSFLLKQRVTRVFPNSTVTEAVTTICNEFGIKANIQPSKRRFEQLIIPGLSYWEWIQEQARKLGYAAYMDELTLLFKPFDSIVDMKAQNVPVLSMHTKGAKFAEQWLDRTLDYIEVTHGHYLEGVASPKSLKHVGGVNPDTGQVLSATQSPDTVGTNLREAGYSPFFDEYRSDIVVETTVAAEEAVSGAAGLARFTTPAIVKCQGDPRIHPFGVILVERTGKLTDGFWIVQDALHIFGRTGEYQMELTALTDGTKDNLATPIRPRTPSRIGVIDVKTLMQDQLLSGTGLNVALLGKDRLPSLANSLPSFFTLCWINLGA